MQINNGKEANELTDAIRKPERDASGSDSDAAGESSSRGSQSSLRRQVRRRRSTPVEKAEEALAEEHLKSELKLANLARLLQEYRMRRQRAQYRGGVRY